MVVCGRYGYHTAVTMAGGGGGDSEEEPLILNGAGHGDDVRSELSSPASDERSKLWAEAKRCAEVVICWDRVVRGGGQQGRQRKGDCEEVRRLQAATVFSGGSTASGARCLCLTCRRQGGQGGVG